MADFLISQGLQSAYTGIAEKNANTIYVCTDTGNMYLGATPLFAEGAFVDAQLLGTTVKFTTKGGGSTVDVDLSPAFDANGAAAAVKAELLGTSGDPSSSMTLYGLKAYVGEQISQSITAVYKYKGSCTYEELPSDDNTVGDVWDVTDAHDTYPAGTNYAWNGTSWDPLAGSVDLSNYVTNENLLAQLAGYVPTTRTVNGQALSGDITLDGADIQLTGYVKGEDTSAVAPTDTVNAAIAKLENRIVAAASGGVTSIAAANNSVTVSSSTGDVAVGVKLSTAGGTNLLTLESDGLRVAPMQWGTF